MMKFFLFFLIFISFSYSSEINIYFTDPENTPSSLSNLSTNQKPIDFALRDFILSASTGTTMYVCIYEIDNTTITAAIDEVVKKGVNLYCIFHTTKTNDISHILSRFTTSSYSNFKSTGMGSSPLMHNKFVVLKSSKIWTGSYNFTVSATYEQDNFALEIFSKDLAEIYEKAFWYMWNGSGNISDFNGKQTILSDSTKITVYFNPYAQNPQLSDVLIENWYDKIEEKPKIQNLYFTVAWFNYEGVGSITEYLKLLKNKNVNIYGILDDDSMNISVLQNLKSEGINIYFDSRKTLYGSGLMHHKFCVLNPYGENPKVICGSANWTQAALTPSGGNYENLLVVESRQVAEVFYKEFLRLYNKAVSQQVTPKTDELVEEILFYPNPTKEKLNIKFKPNIGVKEIKFLLVSLYGVKIFEQNLDFISGVENKVEVAFPSDINDGLYYTILRVKSVGYNKDYVRKIIIK